ncbi:MAG: MFS transporter, partial [Ginsengibacter sp.]
GSCDYGCELATTLASFIYTGSNADCTGAFTLGFAPLSWIIVSEIFPNRIRSKALAVVCFFLFFSSFITAQVFPMLTHLFNVQFNNASGVYIIFAILCFACAVFSWKMVPETKGLSLERIGDLWRNKNFDVSNKNNTHNKREITVNKKI